MRTNLRRTLHRLEHKRAYVHSDGDRFVITDSGMRYVEDQGLFHPLTAGHSTIPTPPEPNLWPFCPDDASLAPYHDRSPTMARLFEGDYSVISPS